MPEILEQSDVAVAAPESEATAMELQNEMLYLAWPRSYAFAQVGGKLASILKIDTTAHSRALIATIEIPHHPEKVTKDGIAVLEIYAIANAYFVFKLAKHGDFIVCPQLKFLFLAPSALASSEPRSIWVARQAVNVNGMERLRRNPSKEDSRAMLEALQKKKPATVQELGENGELW